MQSAIELVPGLSARTVENREHRLAESLAMESPAMVIQFPVKHALVP